MATLVGMIGITTLWLRAVDAAESANLARQQAQDEAEQRRRLLYRSDMNEAMQAWQDAYIGGVVKALQRHRPAPGEKDLRGFEWYYLNRLCRSVLEVPTLTHDQPVTSVTYSPNGKILATGCGDGTVLLWQADTLGPAGQCRGLSQTANSMCFSPDGRWLAAASDDGRIVIWETGAYQAQTTIHQESLPRVEDMAFSPDGNLLAVAPGFGPARLIDVQFGTVRKAYNHRQDGTLPRSVAFSGDGDTLAVGCEQGHIILFDMNDPDKWKTLEGHRNRVWCLTYSGDGKTLASASEDNTIRLWDTGSDTPRETLTGHTNKIWSIVFSPSGEVLASAGTDRTIKFWQVSNGRQIDEIRGHSNTVAGLAYTPDGRRLASASFDRNVKLWDLCPPVRQRKTASDEEVDRSSPAGLPVWTRELDILRGHEYGPFSVAFSPDGTRIASGGYNVRLWDVGSGQSLGTLSGTGWGPAYDVV